MEVKLVVVGGKASKSEVTLTLPATIGRSRDASLTIAHMSVSRHHCQLEERDGQIIVRDNGSLNGTLVDGQRITEHVLQPGERIAIGPLTFQAFFVQGADLEPVAAEVSGPSDPKDGLEQWLSQMAGEPGEPAADEAAAGAPEVSDQVAPPFGPAQPQLSDVAEVPDGPLGAVGHPLPAAGGPQPPQVPPVPEVPPPLEHQTTFDLGAPESSWSEPTDTLNPSDEEPFFDLEPAAEPPLAADPAAVAGEHLPAPPSPPEESSLETDEESEDPSEDPSLQDFFRRLP